MTTLSIFEDLNAFDSASAESRERFSQKLAAWRAQDIASRRTVQTRTSSFEFSDLQAQDEQPLAAEEAA